MQRVAPINQSAVTGIHEQFQATSQALLAVEDAHLDKALASVQWERRGVLQRLVRRPLA